MTRLVNDDFLQIQGLNSGTQGLKLKEMLQLVEADSIARFQYDQSQLTDTFE